MAKIMYVVKDASWADPVMCFDAEEAAQKYIDTYRDAHGDGDKADYPKVLKVVYVPGGLDE